MTEKNRFILNPWLIITGGVMGIFAGLLAKAGNPANMGICVICSYRDIAGALGIHPLKALSYIRPEIIGFFIGAAISALLFREFKPAGGSNPVMRLVIGFVVGLNGLIFLGCPIRMFVRLGGGDWTALSGLLGIIVSVIFFNIFVDRGFYIGKSRQIPNVLGWFGPGLGIVLLILLLVNFRGLNATHKSHAPIYISLIAGLILGVLGQRSRFCSIGGTADLVIIRNFNQVQGTIALLVFVLITNLIIGQFKPGQHPLAHNLHLWNFLSMLVVGLGSLMSGGCPFKQTILSGQGNFDSFISVIGIILGAGLAHTLGFAASPNGVPVSGRVAVIISMVIIFLIGLLSTKKEA